MCKKWTCFVLSICFALSVYSNTEIDGEKNPRIIVKNNKFYLYSVIVENGKQVDLKLSKFLPDGEKVELDIQSKGQFEKNKNKFAEKTESKKEVTFCNYLATNYRNKTYWCRPYVGYNKDIFKIYEANQININECLFSNDWDAMLKCDTKSLSFSLKKFLFKHDESMLISSIAIDNDALCFLGVTGEMFSKCPIHFFSFTLNQETSKALLLDNIYWHPSINGNGMSNISQYNSSCIVLWRKQHMNQKMTKHILLECH